MTRDPQLFFRSCTKPVVVFDEIHQLRDPARLLKIGADVFPKLKILATGSSTLAASKKFRDTLTGRKRTIHLPPVLWGELAALACRYPSASTTVGCLLRFSPIANDRLSTGSGWIPFLPATSSACLGSAT